MSDPAAETVYTAGRVWTGERGGVVRDGAVVAVDGRIAYVGPAADAPVRAHARRVDFGPDATLLPGLIDCHVHLAGSRQYGWEAVPAYQRAARAVADLGRLLRAGYTTVRDVGGAIALGLREAVIEGSVAGPRVLAAGPILSQTGGHADVHSLPLRWAMEQEDAILADGPSAVRQAVRRICRLNADLVKICTTGGVGSEFDSPHDTHYTPEEVRAVVEEAHRLGRRVASHAQGADGVRMAVEAGVDTIEHGYYLDPAAVDAMAARGTVLVPTLVLARVYRETLAAGTDMPAYRRRKQAEAMDAMAESVRLALAAGVAIASGSDFVGAPGREHGGNARDVVALAEVGMGAEGALLAATATAARALGVDDQVGRLVVGLDADMAAFGPTSPLDSPAALLDGALAVVQRGRLVFTSRAGALEPAPLTRLRPRRPAA
ncbi:MAG: amidohydrolase family protein [Firmicutes bacterium]|nr:amidohydrolase family protein [Bacillota bacterium]